MSFAIYHMYIYITLHYYMLITTYCESCIEIKQAIGSAPALLVKVGCNLSGARASRVSQCGDGTSDIQASMA